MAHALEYEVSPVNGLGLVAGYSISWLKKDAGGNDNEDSYLLGAKYDILKNTRLKASYSKKIRFPAIRQLYEAGDGNPNLQTEKSYNYEAGVEQSLPWNNTVIGLTGFSTDVKNYIEKDDATQIFLNNNKYRFKGFELTGETTPIRNLHAAGLLLIPVFKRRFFRHGKEGAAVPAAQ